MDQGFKDMPPELFTPESIQRKSEILFSVLLHSPQLQKHAISCEKNIHKEDCKICDNMAAFSNAVLITEREHGERMNIKGILDFYRKIYNK